MKFILLLILVGVVSAQPNFPPPPFGRNANFPRAPPFGGKFPPPPPGGNFAPPPPPFPNAPPPRPFETAKVKLTYFDMRGRAEPIRLMLHYVNTSFEDERIQPKHWPALKSKTAFGVLPLIKLNEYELAESWAIYRYIGKRYFLAGWNDWEAATLDQTAELFRDFYGIAFLLADVERGLRKGDKSDIYNNQYIPTAKAILPLLEKQIKASGFFGYSAPTWADFLVADFIDQNNNTHAEVMKQYPKLLEHSRKVLSLSQIQNYLKSRKSNI